MAKKADKEIYVADFETSHEIRNGKEYAWVWCAGYQRLFTERKDESYEDRGDRFKAAVKGML